MTTTEHLPGDVRPRMLFLRRYRGFTGGQLKWLHYLGHTIAHGHFRPVLHVTPDSHHAAFDDLLPKGVARTGLPADCEALFLAGLDWQLLDAAGQAPGDRPVINLIQGVRHADPGETQHQFLIRPALRLCVSQQVAEAITATGRLNGPVHVIENGLDLSELAALRRNERNGRVLILGYKDRMLAQATGAELQARGIGYDLLLDRLARGDYLARLADYDHAILLPLPQEGFYLPALEAMALGVTVIMPDCIGARGFARDGDTCLIAPRDPAALADAAACLVVDPARATALRQAGLRISTRHDLATERRKFSDILDRIAA